jgi:hypothetical protein
VVFALPHELRLTLTVKPLSHHKKKLMNNRNSTW